MLAVPETRCSYGYRLAGLVPVEDPKLQRVNYSLSQDVESEVEPDVQQRVLQGARRTCVFCGLALNPFRAYVRAVLLFAFEVFIQLISSRQMFATEFAGIASTHDVERVTCGSVSGTFAGGLAIETTSH